MIQSPGTSRKSIEAMNNIRERDFRGIDLNLLVTLLVLLRERSVSRAAASLHLGQPAVSGALARLRDTFKDPLLVRGPAGMLPTPRALALQAALGPALESIQAVVTDEPGFDPATLRRTFVLGMPDWIDTWLLAPLLARVTAQAPGVRVQVVETDRFRLAEMLAQQALDVAVGSFPEGPRWQHMTALRSLRFCCVSRPDVAGPQGLMALAQYAAMPHLMVTYRSALEGTVDTALAAHGLQRHILATSPRFASLPRVLQEVPAVATVPEVLAPLWRQAFGLVSQPAPLELPSIQVSIVRHANRTHDTALDWLCGELRSAAGPAP